MSFSNILTSATTQKTKDPAFSISFCEGTPPSFRMSEISNLRERHPLVPQNAWAAALLTVMLACWHYLNPDNGKESDLIAAAISQSQIKLREDFDAVFGAGHGVTVKPKGSQVFNYDGTTISFDKLAKDESPTKTQRVLENFANSETSAFQRLKKMVDGKFYTSGRFVITKHKLGFEKEMLAEKTMETMQKFLGSTGESGVSMASRTFIFDVDFAADLAIGFDPDAGDSLADRKSQRKLDWMQSALYLLLKGIQE